jgi:hypothetical protein
MMILVGILAVVAVCLVNHSSSQRASRAEKMDLHGYEHRTRCEEILPLDYLSR